MLHSQRSNRKQSSTMAGCQHASASSDELAILPSTTGLLTLLPHLFGEGAISMDTAARPHESLVFINS
jgi:hypothetical protein